MNDSLGRRPSMTSPVGPSEPITKCRSGGSYGPFRTGFSSVAAVATVPVDHVHPFCRNRLDYNEALL